MTNKAPNAAVTIPIGSSCGASINRLVMSLKTTKRLPISADTTNNPVCSGPTIALAKCGTINPINPITPTIDTKKPVDKAQTTKISIRSRFGLTPKLWAVLSPSNVILFHFSRCLVDGSSLTLVSTFPSTESVGVRGR